VSVAEGAPGRGARRAALFADETGASGWTPVVRFCLAELADLGGVVAAGTGGAAAEAAPAANGAASRGGVKWNALAGALRRGGGSGGAGAAAAKAARDADVAEWALRGRFYRAAWCLRALAGLAAASLREDTFGVAQLSSPGLGDAVAGLLAAAGVLQAHVRAAAVRGGDGGRRVASGAGGWLAVARCGARSPWLLGGSRSIAA
jgi:hypothetical protein